MKEALTGILFFLFIGATFADPISKVVNGTDAEISEFPYMVSLRSANGHSCGGSIINDLWVLTAAHCVQARPDNYTVQYGNTVIRMNGTNVVRVAEFIPHEGYNASNQYINDIALVRLEQPLTNELHDYKVRLPLSGSYFATGTPSVLAGWGRNATGGSVQQTLQKVNLQVYSSFDCAQIHRSKIHYSNICGGVPGGYQGQCNGDSGGPLMVDGVQVGIVSWSVKPCTVPPYPGVYTGVSHYIDWIAKKTGINFKLNLFLRAKNAS